jgi:hypothetical protein
LHCNLEFMGGFLQLYKKYNQTEVIQCVIKGRRFLNSENLDGFLKIGFEYGTRELLFIQMVLLSRGQFESGEARGGLEDNLKNIVENENINREWDINALFSYYFKGVLP